MNPACVRALPLLFCSPRGAAAAVDARRFSSARMYQINWFAVLGVEATASQADIKAAFRQHAKTMHPDVAPSGSRDTQDKFKLISEASAPAMRACQLRTHALPWLCCRRTVT